MPKFFVIVLAIFLLLIGFYAYRTQLDFKDTSKRVTNFPKTENSQNAAFPSKDIPAVSVVATGLEIPWALAFLPDGSILVTERPGRLRVIDKDGKLNPKPVTTLSDVKQIGEGGLLGLVIHPDFEKNHYLYLYYTYSEKGSNTLNRVTRYKYEDNSLKEQSVILDKIPGSTFHDGGRIKFGPDKFLYITTGDAENPSQAQDKNSLAGKILRIKDDGIAEVYSYGHRNPQGITWDKDGKLWATEHGRSGALSGLDELNLIEPGKNYGWPTIQGDKKKDGMVTPVLNSGPDTTWAPAGVAFTNGSLYFGGLRGQTLYQFNIDTHTLTEHFKGQFGRIRDVILGPDNMLYITTSNRDGRGSPSSDDDKIIRINPTKL